MTHEMIALPVKEANGISAKTMEIHYGKLYKGYVDKRNEVEGLLKNVDLTKANQTYSELRGLKMGETFAANGMILHAVYFGAMGGNGAPQGRVAEMIKKDFGSHETFETQLIACGIAARGWAVVAYDPSDKKIHIYCGDMHNQGGVWGCTPLIAVDVYEHAYFIDWGSDRKSYIQAYLKTLNWKKIDEFAQAAHI